MDKPVKNDENCPTLPLNTNFEEIFSQSPIGIFLYDKEGKLTNANDSALNIARIPKLDDVLGTNIFDNPKIATRKAEILDKRLIKFQDSLDLIKIKEQNIYKPIESKIIDIEWTVSVIESGYLVQIQDITKQKFVEDSLKESESTLRSFFDATGDMRGIIEIISDNDILHIADNIITAGYLGITPDMMRNKLSSELGEPKEIIHRWIRHYKESKRTGKPVSFEYLDERENNEAWLVATVNYIGINSQGQSRYSYVVRDITERKKAEYLNLNIIEDLRASETLLSDITNLSSDIIYIKDRQSRWIFANPALEQITGRNADYLIGKTDLEIYSNSEIGKTMMENDRRIMESGKEEIIEEIIETPDGMRSFISVKTPRFNENGQIIGIIGISHDITDRKKVESDLKRQAALLNLSYEAIFSWDLDKGIQSWNKGAEILYGYTEKEAIGHVSHDLLKTQFPIELQEFQEILTRNKSWTGELVHTKKDGNKIIVESRQQMIQDTSGINVFIETNRDITKKKKTEFELKKLSKQLQLALDAANMGWWNYNPLTDISTYDKRYKEIFGVSGCESPNEEILKILHPDDIPGVWAKVEEALDPINPKKYYAEYRIYRNNEIRWIEAHGIATFEGYGSLRHAVSLVGTVNDITERKKSEKYRKALLEKEQELTEELKTSNEELQSTTDELLKIYEELQKSSKLLSTIYELNPDAIVLTTLSDSKIIDCNQEYLNQIGYTREEVIGHTSEELSLISEITRDAYIDETRGKEKVSNFEGKIRQKNGSIIDVMYSTRQITVNNEPIILNIGQDITKRKIQEEELRESEERLVLAQRLGNVGVWDWNTVTNALTFTPELEQLYGLIPGTIKTYDDWRQLTHPDDIEKIEAEREQNIANHEPFDLEFRIFHKSGELRWLSAKGGAIYNDKGDVLRVLGINTDITERKTADKKIIELIEQLQQSNKEYTQSEERFQDLADNIPNLAWMADANGWIFWYNKQWYDYTGTTFEEMQGWGWQKVHHPDYVDSVTEEWSTKILEGEQYDNIFPLKGKNGNYRWFLTRIIPIRDEYGKVQRWFGTNTDFTEQKIIEENLENTMDELKQSNKELEQFAYITSHDLREPLRMITSFLQLLEKRYKDQLDQDASEFIGFAVNGAKRLDAMTKDLLKYSQITNEKREIIPVNFEHVLEHALTNLKVQIEENNAIITHDPLPTIKGDEQLKIQLFQNIIGNAIKYRSQETPKIHISATKERNQYLFSIKDNGIGMSFKHLERIFTIFKRLHTHEEYEGTGIGLAIAQKIVHQQGGQIWAESELGKGTTFYFTIPIN